MQHHKDKYIMNVSPKNNSNSQPDQEKVFGARDLWGMQNQTTRDHHSHSAGKMGGLGSLAMADGNVRCFRIWLDGSTRQTPLTTSPLVAPFPDILKQ